MCAENTEGQHFCSSIKGKTGKKRKEKEKGSCLKSGNIDCVFVFICFLHIYNLFRRVPPEALGELRTSPSSRGLSHLFAPAQEKLIESHHRWI